MRYSVVVAVVVAAAAATVKAMKAMITIAILLRYDYDPTIDPTTIPLRGIAYITIAIQLRYDDTTTHSTTTEVIEITICVRFDYDTTTTRLWRKIDMFIFLLASNCVEWKQVRTICRSWIVVVS